MKAPVPTSSIYDRAVQQRGLSEVHHYLLEQVPPQSAVLELGPASGYMTRILASKGCVVDAIEINARDAEKARPFCRELIIGSADDEQSFASLTGPYDVAILADVLEHLRHPETTLAQVRQRLAANGVILVSLPNVAYWRMRLELLRGRFDYSDEGLLDRTHLHFYTLKSTTELFANAGFKIEKLSAPLPLGTRLKGLKSWLRKIRPQLFAVNFVLHLRIDCT